MAKLYFVAFFVFVSLAHLVKSQTCPKNRHCQDFPLLNSINIDCLADCETIFGSLTILDLTFTGYQDYFSNGTLRFSVPPLHPDRLEVLSNTKQINGFIQIKAEHPDFRNLTFLRNLLVIGTGSNSKYSETFYTLSIVRTSLESIELPSLKTIHTGGGLYDSIAIIENRKLCNVERDAKLIRKAFSPVHSVNIFNNCLSDWKATLPEVAYQEKKVQ